MRAAFLISALLLGAALPAHAGEDPVRRWTTALGSPATADAVSKALDDALEEPGSAVHLARALGATRGHVAILGLRELLRHREAAVRTEALLSVARLGLRSEKLGTAVRKLLKSSFVKAKERRAAILALGAAGDGRDIPALLKIASEEEKDTDARTAAFRAMRAITGATLPFVHTRWTYWWRKQDVQGRERLSKALSATVEAKTRAARLSHETSVANLGWLDLPATRKALRSWLRSAAEGLLAPSCNLAAHLRLADLKPEISGLLKGRPKATLRKAAERALKRLGVVLGAAAR